MVLGLEFDTCGFVSLWMKSLMALIPSGSLTCKKPTYAMRFRTFYYSSLAALFLPFPDYKVLA
jgi:hypothetical protein